MVAAAILLVAFLFQGTWALAGTTGGVSGQVTDSSGAPVAGAKIVVSSPSQHAAVTTDNSGRFNLLSLAPDTYSVSIEKDGYDPISYTGLSVFADNNQTLSFKLTKSLKTIARVTSRSAGDVVKSGVGSDIYNVNATAIQKSAALGG
ncbi:MAG TPA: carboxypeptidase-like regulatory domain-containing protein, partial [Candidatus Baltobacteraceae bacterium]|nr:carboxypeptidase-like regulatory domain-containing protein [Candidatus Baltobacteraceae bacterium]